MGVSQLFQRQDLSNTSAISTLLLLAFLWWDGKSCPVDTCSVQQLKRRRKLNPDT